MPRFRDYSRVFISFIIYETPTIVGMSSPMMGVAAVNSLLFGVYGGLLHYQMEHSDPPSSQASLSQIFIAGSASGVVTSFISTPMELVKIRLQTQGIDGLSLIAHMKTSTSKPPGPMQLTRQIWHVEGFRGLYRGQGVTLIRETPSYGAYFVVVSISDRKKNTLLDRRLERSLEQKGDGKDHKF